MYLYNTYTINDIVYKHIWMLYCCYFLPNTHFDGSAPPNSDKSMFDVRYTCVFEPYVACVVYCCAACSCYMQKQVGETEY